MESKSNNKKKYVSVYEDNWEDSKDWPPEEPHLFLEWFENKFKKIPSDYLDTAVVCLSGEDFCGNTYAAINIYYYRDETENEIKERIRIQNIVDRQEKETLNELIIKHYGAEARIVNKKQKGEIES